MGEVSPTDPAIVAKLDDYARQPRGNCSGRTWTVDELLLLLDPAVPVTAIMERLNVKRAVVTYELVKLRRVGFPVPGGTNGSVRAPRTIAIEDDLRAGLTKSEAGRRYEVSPGRINEIRHRAAILVQHHGWTDEERTLVIAHQDRSAREVAALVGRSVRAVDGLRSQLIAEGRIRPKKVRPRKRAPSP